jgi:hypothetical protein
MTKQKRTRRRFTAEFNAEMVKRSDRTLADLAIDQREVDHRWNRARSAGMTSRLAQ